MPIIPESSYQKRPFYFFNRHLETIAPALFNRTEYVPFQRERLELPDGDFLDLDWLKGSADRLLVLSHGLEGGADKHYVRRAAAYFHQRKWDIVAWNCRGCSGELNRLPRLYHHGSAEDLAYVVDHLDNFKNYKTIVLIGFSMGGSITLKYLGAYPGSKVAGAVTFSVSADLLETVDAIENMMLPVYKTRFLRKMKEKVRSIAEKHPESVDVSTIDSVKDFNEFHTLYTVPLHGYLNIGQFYEDASCRRYLPAIKKPSLMVNALNDPLLGEKCFPYAMAKESDSLYLETPRYGGHLGFSLPGLKHSWMEERAEQFIESIILYENRPKDSVILQSPGPTEVPIRL